MKVYIILLFYFCVGSLARGQNSTTPTLLSTPNGLGTVDVSPYAITERGPHHRIWQKVTSHSGPRGEMIYRTNSYTELATGLHHWNGQQWVDSSDQIQITAAGASATNAQHQVNFAANINTAGSIDLTMPSGQHLRSHVVGLAYYDQATSNSVMFAETKDSIGQLLPASNQVVYADAFTDLKADVRYTHRRNGFEQDIILRSQPPSPTQFGLDPQTTHLQIWTEFLNPPQPAIKPSLIAAPVPLQKPAGRQTLYDEDIGFESMQMDQGKAFVIEGKTNELAAVPVAKRWVQAEGRTFLIEEVLLNSVARQIQSLPPPASPGPSGSSPSGGSGASLRLKLPAPKQEAKVKRPLQLARSAAAQPGLVLDYNTIINNFTDFTFQADSTYYVSGTVNLYGTTTIEGGTVVKSGVADSAITVIENDLLCNTAPYRPAIFTCTNDNSVGETISGSSGTPNLAITTYVYLPANGTVSNLFFRYAFNGLSSDATDVELWDCQFMDCSHPITVNADTSTLGLHNILITMDDAINNSSGYCSCEPGALTIYSQELSVFGENVTADLGSQDFIIYFISLADSSLTSVNLMNSILITPKLNAQYSEGLGGGNADVVTETNTTFYASSLPTGLFQTVGAATHYLADGSPYRDFGNTNITAELLAELKYKTTYPPIAFAQAYYSYSLTMFPQAQRDKGPNPDLGYHYDPIDFAFGGIVATNATLTITPGTVIAGFGTNGYLYGISLGSDSQFSCQGTPTNLCRVVEYNAVQEQSNTNWLEPTVALVTSQIGDSPSSSAYCRFTDFSVIAQDAGHYYGDTSCITPSPNFQDCQFHGGVLDTEKALNLTNCLLERVKFTLRGFNSNMRNCLFWQGSVDLLARISGTTVQDNMFDRSLISDLGNYTYGCNAFFYTNAGVNILSLTNSSDVFATNNFSYQTSWLGRYYQTNSSPFIDKGNTTANNLGLFHYTTQTNQAKETNSTVDIGFHYVALDNSGNPLDYDSDGIPDYFEDTNGNGTYDIGIDLSNWTINSTSGDGIADGIKVAEGRNPATNSILDTGGIIGLQTYTILR